MINIASAVEHSDETICSLDFGNRTGGVRWRVEKALQVASTSAGELEAKRTQLSQLQREVRAMEARGEQDTFDGGAAPSEVRAFKENKARVAILTREGREAAVALAEANAGGNARGGGGGGGGGSVETQTVARLAERQALAEKEAANLNRWHHHAADVHQRFLLPGAGKGLRPEGESNEGPATRARPLVDCRD